MSVKSAILEATIALQYLKCSEVDWGEVEMRVANIRAELAKPDLLMACKHCQMVDTPRLTPAFLANETHFDTKCPHCGSQLYSVKRSEYEHIYKEQHDMPDENTKFKPAEPVTNQETLDSHEFAFTRVFGVVQAAVHGIAIDHGWWDGEVARGPLELQMLIVSEIAEAAEAARHGNPPSDHIPEFSGEEEEYADAIIRIMDLAEKRGLRIAEALIAKARFNESRPYRHGGKLA